MSEQFRDLQSFYSGVLSLPCTATDVSITVDPAPAVSSAYLILEPNTSNEEILLMTANTAGVLTVTRGLASSGSSEASGTGKAHAAGTEVIIADAHLYIKRLQVSKAFEYRGAYASTTLINAISNPTLGDVAIDTSTGYLYWYNGSAWVTASGGTTPADASTTVKGITKLSTAPASATNPIAVGDNDPRMLSQGENDAAQGTVGTPSDTNRYVTDDDTEGTGNVIRASSLTSKVVINAGENISGAATPLAVMQYKSTDVLPVVTASQETSDSDGDVYGATWKGQTFTTSAFQTVILGVEILTDFVNSPAGNLTVSIYATAAGLPTGAALATKSITAQNIDAHPTTGWNRFIFASPLTVTPSTVYAIVVSVPSGDGSNKVHWLYKNSNVYSGGTMVQSTDSGVNWSTATADMAFKVYGYGTLTTAKLYLSTANVPEKAAFLGFVSADVLASADATVQVSDVVGGFTGLTPGAMYYVQDTAGTIGTTPGTYKIPVGKAVSATQIKIDKSNVASGVITVPGTTITGKNVFTNGNSTFDFSAIVGFRPRVIELTLSQVVVPGTTAGTYQVRGVYDETTGKYYCGLMDTNTTLAMGDFDCQTGNITIASSSTNTLSVVISINLIANQGFVVRLAPTYNNGNAGTLPTFTINYVAYK